MAHIITNTFAAKMNRVVKYQSNQSVIRVNTSGDKRVVKTILVVILSLCTTLAGAQESQVHEYMLKNGLKLLVKEDHRAPVVVSQVWYKVGASYEHDGLTGISHALEHMMFKGTKKHGEGEFSRIIAENGGNENAFTGDDYTAYFQTMEKSRLPISFELEADRMRNLTLPEEAFRKEIEVVMEERRLRTEDDPNSYLREVMMATAFQTSPYRAPVIGWMADLKGMQAAQLRDWYQLWYAPNNATVVVVGDVNAEEVHQLAKKYFGRLKQENIIPPAHRPEVEQQGQKRVVVKRPAELAQLYLGYKVPGLISATGESPQVEVWEPYALEVLSGILSGGSSARFESRLVRGQQVAAGAGSGYQLTGRLDGMFTISATPAQGRTIDELEAAISEQVRQLQQEEVTAEELQRVKAQVVSGNVYERDSAFYQGMILGTFETVGLGWKMADEYVDRIAQITAAQIQTVAKKYLIDDRSTVGVLEPIQAAQAGATAQGEQHAE